MQFWADFGVRGPWLFCKGWFCKKLDAMQFYNKDFLVKTSLPISSFILMSLATTTVLNFKN